MRAWLRPALRPVPLPAAASRRRTIWRWIRSAPTLPKRIYLTHGEPEAMFAFQQLLRDELGVAVEVPEMGHVVPLP